MKDDDVNIYLCLRVLSLLSDREDHIGINCGHTPTGAPSPAAQLSTEPALQQNQDTSPMHPGGGAQCNHGNLPHSLAEHTHIPVWVVSAAFQQRGLAGSHR